VGKIRSRETRVRRRTVYAIGLRHHEAVQMLHRLRNDPRTLCETAALAAAYPSLHDSLIERIVSIAAEKATRTKVAEELARHQGWTASHRHDIGHWLEAAGVEANAWLADLHDYPRSDRLVTETRARMWRSQHSSQPAVLFLTPAELDAGVLHADELSPDENYFLAHRAFAANPTAPEAALRLLQAAERVQAMSVIAALFASGALQTISNRAPIVAAFHALPWGSHGVMKIRFLAEIETEEHEDPARMRMHALAQSVHGRFSEALRCYDAILDRADPPMIREYASIIAAARNAGENPPFDATMLDTLTGYENQWLRRLTTPMRRSLAELASMAAMELPPATDPLFALAVSFAHRHLAREENTDKLLRELSRRAEAIDPAWRSNLAQTERDYAEIWAGVRSICDSSALAASVLERLLLLEVDVLWIKRILRSLLDHPPEWFTTEDDLSTPMSDVAVASCIRVIDALTKKGQPFDVDQQRSLCSGSAISIIGTTINLIDAGGNT